MYNNPVQVLLLLTPGREAPTSLPQLSRKGYNVSLVDSRVSMDCLTDRLRNRPDFCVRNMSAMANKLRAAWVHMLRRFADADYYTVFGEADCFPLLSAQRMQQWIAEAPEDADVLKLSGLGGRSIWESVYRENPDFDDLPPKWLPMDHDMFSWYAAGTQAMWVKPSARERLADLYANAYMPVDTVLAHISKHRMLNVYRASHNITTQAPYKIPAHKTRIEAYVKVPIRLLVVAVVGAWDSNTEVNICKLKDIVPSNSKFVVSVQEDCETSLENVYRYKPNGKYLSEYLPPISKEDRNTFPVTVFVNPSNSYPDNYLTEISLRYQCLDFSYSQYGFSGKIGSSDKRIPIYKGTLVIATDALESTQLVDISKDNSKFMHYDLSVWNTTDCIEVKDRAVVLSDVVFADSINLADEACRIYNDDVIGLVTARHGVVKNRTPEYITILWDDNEEDVAYRKNKFDIFEKL